MPLRLSIRCLLLLALCTGVGCASLSGPPPMTEAEVRVILESYVKDLAYSQSRLDIAKAIVADIRALHAERLKHDVAYQLVAKVSDTAVFKVRGDKKDVKEVQGALDEEDSSSAFLYEDPLVLTDNDGRALAAEREMRAIQFYGPREIYVLEQSDEDPQLSSVRVLDVADEKRLYRREIGLYKRLEPYGARLLVQRIETEHPEISLNPGEE